MRSFRRVRIGLLAACSLAAGAGMLVAGCSTPGLFPSVLAGPPPRHDTTLSPAQVKEATENLISERHHLCLEAIAAEGRHWKAAAAAKCSDGGDIAAAGSTRSAGAGFKP